MKNIRNSIGRGVAAALAVCVLSVSAMALVMNKAPRVTNQPGTVQPYKMVLVWGFTCTGASNWVDNPGNIMNWTVTAQVPLSNTHWSIGLEGTMDGVNGYTLGMNTQANGSGSTYNYASFPPADKVRIRVPALMSATTYCSTTVYGYR